MPIFIIISIVRESRSPHVFYDGTSNIIYYLFFCLRCRRYPRILIDTGYHEKPSDRWVVEISFPGRKQLPLYAPVTSVSLIHRAGPGLLEAEIKLWRSRSLQLKREKKITNVWGKKENSFSGLRSPLFH